MIYFEYESMDPCFWFGLERELLQNGAPDEVYFLLWRTAPTLMLGRYQNAAAEIDGAYAESRGVRVVRRLTGGGTIYTDPGSWQFSYIQAEQTRQIDFEAFVRPILDALRRMGLDAQMSTRNDLLLDGRKFCGNAQQHGRGRVLHHGSLLFDTDFDEMARCLTVDPDKIRSKGIRSVRQRVINLKERLGADIDALEFQNRLLSALLPEGARRRLSPEVVERVRTVHAPLFDSWDWVYGQAPSFQLTHSRRLPGGRVEVRLNLDGGVISDCAITGDFFFAGELDAVCQSLRGCRFRREDITSVLAAVLAEQPFYQISPDELTNCILNT